MNTKKDKINKRCDDWKWKVTLKINSNKNYYYY